MAIVGLKLPNVKHKTEVRPRACPYCQGNTLQRWGQVSKPVKDMRVMNIRVYRYCCCQCKRTFCHYPDGNSRADQTERLRVFAIPLWRLGLSHRASSLILSGLHVRVSFMTIWRDVQEEAKQIQKHTHWKPVSVVGLDGAYVLGWGAKQRVLVAVDLGTGQPLALGYLDEFNPQAVQRWLAPLIQRHGITVIVTDHLSSYKLVSENLQLEHQICHSTSVVGSAKLSRIYKKPFRKNGYGSWMKFSSSLTTCHLTTAKLSLPSGNSSPVVVPCPTKFAPRSSSYEIFSCA